MKQVILFIDNDEETLEVWGKVLTKAGFEFKPAKDPQEARKLLLEGGIDLAVIDMRLKDDNDELDVSGLDLAAENLFSHIPKIILTGFKPSPEQISRLQDLSPYDAVIWVNKNSGPERLLEEIPKLISLWSQMQRIKSLAGKISTQLEDDQADIRKDARRNYWIAAISSVVGFVIIITGIILALVGDLGIGIVAAAGGIVTEVSGLLFFRRLDAANERMDQYHRELLQTYWLEMLLAVCEPLPAESQIAMTERIIKAATKSWFPPISTVQ